jgi:hypothetical protein
MSGRSLRALGSNWSLSLAGVADDIIDTRSLSMHLGQPYPAGSTPLSAGRIRNSGNNFLELSCTNVPDAAGRHFVHVEAGIKVKDLLADLGACGLALPTMGDGAGQSLVGALSTATHGADFQVPPLVEWLRAVHLVGPGGQEWWITPQTTIFGNQGLLSVLPDWCPDTQIVADDTTFDAARVGVGRMGVIYAVIMEVVENYTLIDVNLEHRWNEVRAALAVTSAAGGNLTGIFDQSLADLDDTWLQTEVLKRSVYVGGPGGGWGGTSPSGWGWSFNPGGEPGFYYASGWPGWASLPPYFQDHPDVYSQIISNAGLDTLAAELRGGAPMLLHHMNLAISLSTTERCWIRRRWSRQQAVDPVNLGQQGSDDPIVAAIKANPTDPFAIVQPVKDNLQYGLDWGTEFLASITLNTQWERLDWYLRSEIQHVAEETAAIGGTSFEAVVLILYELATDDVLQTGEAAAQAASGLIAGAFSNLVRAGPAAGGANMLDNHDYSLDGAEVGDSAEFIFDAMSSNYLDFIDAVAGLAKEHFPVFGYIGVRFMPGSTALIAMQQFGANVSVEISTAKTRVRDLFGAFWSDVHNAATTHGGIPHWGQEFPQPADYLDARYGDRITKWRAALASLSGTDPGLFSTPFSRDKGLEPDGSDDAIDAFFLGLGAGSDYRVSQ